MVRNERQATALNRELEYERIGRATSARSRFRRRKDLQARTLAAPRAPYRKGAKAVIASGLWRTGKNRILDFQGHAIPFGGIERLARLNSIDLVAAVRQRDPALITGER
jgi:hypothetical protein